MTNDLVTCVIPTRNRASLLSRALESVARQSYSNLAVVVVDDHSSDGTREVVRSFVDHIGEAKATYIRNRRTLGAAISRNIGIQAVDSKYVAFLDDDDVWLPKKVQTQMCHISDYPLVGSRIRIIDANPTTMLRRLKRWGQGLIEPITSPVSSEDLLVSNCGMSPSTILARVGPVRDLGGFDDTLTANQGRDFLIRCGLEFGPILRVNQRLVLQHQEHDFGRISESGGKRFEAMQIVHDRYRHLMPKWLLRFDRARMSLLKARLASGRERKRLEKEAWSCFDPAHPLRFARLYFAYFRDQKP